MFDISYEDLQSIRIVLFLIMILLFKEITQAESNEE